jgi:hypothetical protein
MPPRRRAPQHARALALEARLGLWPLLLRRTSSLHSCRPRRHGLAVEGCLAHVDAEEGAPPSSPASARFATGRRFHLRVFVPSCCRLVRRHPWRRPKLRRAARFQSVPGLSPCRSPLRACAPKRAPSHARRAPPDQRGHPRQHQRRVAVAAPAPAPDSPRRPPTRVLAPFEPRNPRES